MFDQPRAPYEPKFYHQAGTYRVDVGPAYYLGSTTRFGDRASYHRADLAAGRHPNKKLQAAWDEHQGFSFTVLTIIPTKDHDVGRDHIERLKFHEQLLLDAHFSDPKCCNASESSRYNTTISEVMKKKWLDPEYRTAALRKIRAARLAKPVSPETRAKQGAAKRGLRNYHSRPCVLTLPGGREEAAFPCVSDAARFAGVTQQAMHSWFEGLLPWPGSGARRSRHIHLTGITGRYVTREEYLKLVPTPVELGPEILPPAGLELVEYTGPAFKYPPRPVKAPKPEPGEWRKGEQVIECELTFAGQDPARYASIHAAARVAKTTHLKMYLWLTGEKPWPEGLTGRLITPL